MGTDFTYGDMGSRKLNDHNYKLLRSEEFDGVDCYVVESTPKTDEVKDETGYNKSEVWVRKDNYIVIQSKFYDKDGDFLKVMHSTNIQKIDGKMWIPMNLEMQNIQKNHSTHIVFDNVKVDTDVSDEFFTQRYLKRGK